MKMFYEILNQQLDQIRYGRNLYYRRQKIYKPDQKSERSHGKIGETAINDNGDRFITACKQYNLKINNSSNIRTQVYTDIHGKDPR